jgi:2-dehydropantoate 2-reductase
VTDLVVGGGAIGTLLAWALSTGGRDVAIVRRGLDGRPRPADAVVVDLDGSRRTAAVTEVGAPGGLRAAPDVIVFAVKMYDLDSAVASCAVWPNAASLTPGNGIGAEEILERLRPNAPVVAGSLTVSVDRLADGDVRRLNRGGVGLAAVRGEATALISALADASNRSGIRAATFADWQAMKWSKLVANLVGNASSAILDMAPDAIYASAAGFEVERRQLREALAVMRRLELRAVRLPGADVRLLAAGVRLPAFVSRPILRRVVAAGRGGKDPSLRIAARTESERSEVRWLNGAVAREAERLGGDAPVNRRLTDLVEEILTDDDRRAFLRGRPDRLAQEILRS